MRTRMKAAEALCREPNSSAVSGLAIAVVSDPETSVRQACASALGRTQDPSRIDPLVKALQDKEPDVIRSAMHGLRRVNDDRVIGTLVSLLKHKDFSVRTGAAQTIDTMRWVPKDRDQRTWFSVAKGWYERAASVGAEAMPPLQLTIETGPISSAIRAVEALGSIPDPKVTKLLCNTLNSQEPVICIAAAGSLGKIGGSEAVNALIAALRSNHTQIRAESARALGILGAVEASAPIAKLLGDKEWEVRREAATALGKLNNPETLEPLAKLLDDMDADVREAAAIALAKTGNRKAVPALVMALKDESGSVRRIAAAGLSRIDQDWVSLPETREAAEKLKVAIQDADAAVRFFVAQLLVNLGEMSPEALLGFSPEDPLASPAEKRGRMATKFFIALLEDRDRDVRQAAAEALGHLGGDRARQALTRASNDPDADVAVATQLALQAIKAEKKE